MAGNPIAVIVGVGPGTGAAIARRFATAYPVALLARSPENFEGLVTEINQSGGKALGVSTDVSSETSVKAAFEKIQQEFGKVPIAAAIFNASARPQRKPLLELTVDEFQAGFDVSSKGAFIFSQAVLPGLIEQAERQDAKYPPTLIFTGATASVKANALMSGFTSPKHALRALSLSIAREFAPKGVHVAHAILDGVIDIPLTREWLKDQPAEAKIAPDDIAETYWNLHQQSRRCFTNEIDIRPMLEKW
ncbi:NAD(P)-binding protein [Dissoconium aciculare CBS 342.82]|uniref:NAD(P)-binding protein n=1 Tax=Dissoconium aciculare CBS 342.82 TaxID=1314786 RepID=A0A6J3LT35_9PEZI|nr:NAD(P)-binding protein [Dissoconium aciculare CBS 342.82]KAF1818936.1 NAD(P)-binding protein [Dissoconium aciculare CBS 342.82]